MGDSGVSDVATSVSGDMTSADTGSAGSPTAATPSFTGSDGSGAQPLAGTGGEGSDQTPDATTQAVGPIPYERFREVNERMKAAEQRWQQIEQRYGSVLQLDPGALQGMLGWYQQAAQNPVEFATTLLNELAGNDQYRGQVASQAARILGGLRQFAPKEDPEPQPDLVAENGAAVYSAQQQRAWQEWNQRHLQAAFDAKLAQATAPLQRLQQEQQVAQVTRQAEQVASHQYQQAQTWHGFKQHEAKIAKVFSDNPNLTLQDAYLHVLHTDILPSLPAQAQASVVADMQRKAAAQSLNPGNATRGAGPEVKGAEADDFAKALAHFSKR